MDSCSQDCSRTHDVLEALALKLPATSAKSESIVLVSEEEVSEAFGLYRKLFSKLMNKKG